MPVLSHLDVPPELQRNAPRVRKLGADHTGEVLIRHATRCCGLESLAQCDLLDVGCGVRFTSALINRGIPFKSYTGIEVHRPIVDFLKSHVEALDARFRFAHWDVRNDRYHLAGQRMAEQTTLPLPGEFDVAWLFSVFTHLDPADSAAMLRLVRDRIRDTGRLMFSAFLDERVDGFSDAVAGSPLLRAVYHPALMQELVTQAGWRLLDRHPADPEHFVQAAIVCAPAA